MFTFLLPPGVDAGSSTLLSVRNKNARRTLATLAATRQQRKAAAPAAAAAAPVIGGLRLEPDADYASWGFSELPGDSGALMDPLNGIEALRARVDLALDKPGAWPGQMVAPAPAAAAPPPAPQAPPPPPPPPPGPEVCAELLKAGVGLPATEAFLDCTPFNWYGSSIQGPSSPWGCECSAWSVNCPFETCAAEQAWQEGCLESKVTDLGFTALSKSYVSLNGGSLPVDVGGYSNHPSIVSLCMYWLPQPPNPSFPIVAAPEWQDDLEAITPPPWPYAPAPAPAPMAVDMAAPAAP